MDESIRSRNTKSYFKAWRSRHSQCPCIIAYPFHVLHKLLWSGTSLFHTAFLPLNISDLRASRCPMNTLWVRPSTPSAKRSASLKRSGPRKESMLGHQLHLIFHHVLFHYYTSCLAFAFSEDPSVILQLIEIYS
jgi:hypothetical protein